MSELMQRGMKWLAGDDTGISSKAMFQVLMSMRPERMRWSWPSDNSDLGRCLRMLELFPEFKPRLGEVAAAMPGWKPMIDAWPELEALYKKEHPNHEGNGPILYARMRALCKECDVAEAAAPGRREQ